VNAPQHLGFLGLLLSGFSRSFYPLNFYLFFSMGCDPNQGFYKEKLIWGSNGDNKGYSYF
jgi:hypothetical protein